MEKSRSREVEKSRSREVEKLRSQDVERRIEKQTRSTAWGVFVNSSTLDSSTFRNKPGMSKKTKNRVKKSRSREVEKSRRRETNSRARSTGSSGCLLTPRLSTLDSSTLPEQTGSTDENEARLPLDFRLSTLDSSILLEQTRNVYENKQQDSGFGIQEKKPAAGLEFGGSKNVGSN